MSLHEMQRRPLQNRVTPFGDIVAIAQRGMFTGNRGIIHDPTTKTLLNRRWSGSAWLICVCEYKGRRRDVMSGRSWTELFFLDEAVVLAAGHRPCFLCRRGAAEAFRSAWTTDTGRAFIRAAEIDRALHAERHERGKKRIYPLTGDPFELPDGVFVARSNAAYVVCRRRLFRWDEDGYEPANIATSIDGIITPPSTVKVLRTGYRPVLHAALTATNLVPA